ncbi:MAG: xanthine dehydrogenase small subunit [Pseudomonadota bacterium]
MNSATNFILNGEQVSIDARPDTTVLDMLRTKLQRKGTKEGCAEGDCGACTVLFKRHGDDKPYPQPANACIMTLAQIEGGEITTVEGVGNGVMSELQARMAENGSSQCGYCTPGIVVALTGLMMRSPDPEEHEIHDALAGNLCRCTGYKPIVEAAKSVTGSTKPVPCKVETSCGIERAVTAEGSTVIRPATVEELLEAKAQYADAVLLAGGTDLAVPLAGYETSWPQIITTGSVDALRAIDARADEWTFGAAVTWEEMMHAVADDYPSLATLIRRFGSTQIRSMGTIGGNIGTASPIGDGPPGLIALDATITLQSLERGERSMPLEDFFLDYRKTQLASDELIVSITVPRKAPDQVFRAYKVSKRYDQDISTVCGNFNLTVEDGVIVTARIAYGGMAAIPKRAEHAEAAIVGKRFDADTAHAFSEAITKDFTPLTDWRGTDAYRLRVAQGLFARIVAEHEGETVEVMAL